MTAKHVFFEGRVQGVGFRFTTKQLAKEFDISGWVKNLPDGRVELMVQGDEEEEVNGFVQEIRDSSLAHHIQKVDISEAEPLDEVVGFNIR
tara:strand:+ start:422 stop:694 length:273 start_codon:yes stop_codon:yes gene_type:complete